MMDRKPKILCVDDEPMNLDLYAAMLEPRDFEVIRAESGDAALERIKQENIDLVILDIMMPTVDGFEVCRKIKKDPETAHIPVMMITALDDKNSLARGLQAGAGLFMSKPIKGIDLSLRIKFFLGMPI
ncbi:MAG: response regulator [Nitrospirae bacterium]|nr:response regulator [Nitrospirota bacterium]